MWIPLLLPETLGCLHTDVYTICIYRAKEDYSSVDQKPQAAYIYKFESSEIVQYIIVM